MLELGQLAYPHPILHVVSLTICKQNTPIFDPGPQTGSQEPDCGKGFELSWRFLSICANKCQQQVRSSSKERFFTPSVQESKNLGRILVPCQSLTPKSPSQLSPTTSSFIHAQIISYFCVNVGWEETVPACSGQLPLRWLSLFWVQSFSLRRTSL